MGKISLEEGLENHVCSRKNFLEDMVWDEKQKENKQQGLFCCASLLIFSFCFFIPYQISLAADAAGDPIYERMGYKE